MYPIYWHHGEQAFDGEHVVPLAQVQGTGQRFVSLRPLDSALVKLRRVRHDLASDRDRMNCQVVASEVTGIGMPATMRQYAVMAWPHLYQYLAMTRPTPCMYGLVLEEDNALGFPLLLDLDAPVEVGMTRQVFVAQVHALLQYLALTYGLDAAKDFLVDDTFQTGLGKHSVHIMCRALGFHTTAAARSFATRVLKEQMGFSRVDGSVPSRHGNFKLVGCSKLGKRNAQHPWTHSQPVCSVKDLLAAYDNRVSWDDFYARRPWFDMDDAPTRRYLDVAPLTAAAVEAACLVQPPWPVSVFAYYSSRAFPWPSSTEDPAAARFVALVGRHAARFNVTMLNLMTRTRTVVQPEPTTLAGLDIVLTRPDTSGLPVSVTVALGALSKVRVFAPLASVPVTDVVAALAAAGYGVLAVVKDEEIWVELTDEQCAELAWPLVAQEVASSVRASLVTRPLLPYALLGEEVARVAAVHLFTPLKGL